MPLSEYAAPAFPEGDVLVYENVSRALSDELGCCDREQAGSAAETICEEQDVGCYLEAWLEGIQASLLSRQCRDAGLFGKDEMMGR